eukprot:392093-Pleurochrysis_carterae.AAC.1
MREEEPSAMRRAQSIGGEAVGVLVVCDKALPIVPIPKASNVNQHRNDSASCTAVEKITAGEAMLHLVNNLIDHVLDCRWLVAVAREPLHDVAEEEGELELADGAAAVQIENAPKVADRTRRVAPLERNDQVEKALVVKLRFERGHHLQQPVAKGVGEHDAHVSAERAYLVRREHPVQVRVKQQKVPVQLHGGGEREPIRLFSCGAQRRRLRVLEQLGEDLRVDELLRRHAALVDRLQLVDQSSHAMSHVKGQKRVSFLQVRLRLQLRQLGHELLHKQLKLRLEQPRAAVRLECRQVEPRLEQLRERRRSRVERVRRCAAMGVELQAEEEARAAQRRRLVRRELVQRRLPVVVVETHPATLILELLRLLQLSYLRLLRLQSLVWFRLLGCL